MNAHRPLPRPVDVLEPHIGTARVEAAAAALESLRTALDGRRVVMVTGDDRSKGGVFEIVRTVLPYLSGAGIETGWLDLPTPPDARSALEFLHVLGHDTAPGQQWRTDLARHRDALDRFAETGADEIGGRLGEGDVAVLHDTQTAPLCAVLARTHTVLWHAHIGTRTRGPAVSAYWDLLAPAVSRAHRQIFYLDEYVPEALRRACDLIPPAIDPSSAKAAPLDRLTARSRLRLAAEDTALIEQPGGQLAPPGDDAVLAVQVSRWDPLKDMGGVMALFAEAARRDPCFAGLVVGTAAQSPNERTELDRCTAVRSAERSDVAARLHIWSVQASGTPEHDDVIRIAQSAADVIVQKSLQEGYGLTVTEAMLRGKPVVASDVGGIGAQITDGANGLLVPAPFGAPEALAPLEAACAGGATAAALGAAAAADALRDGCVDRQLLQLCAAFEAAARGG